ncbi:hypothetical protein E3J95_03385 [Candidatus Aerophobetes bacterium]|uniref:Leucine-binding protein domain-containing protein n=1 Tax=Aerophobetes bacterium TaxID=2030807 RepID=A0A523QJN0_UNCAE|nr:MAG: hypothetical protein E3J95_03385 [Candidatus Aerophobetes bacterium]
MVFKKVLIVCLSLIFALTLFAGVLPAEEEIPLGVLTSLTGPLAPQGKPDYDAMQMAVADINAAGGPLGRSIKIFAADTSTDVEKGIMGMRKLVTTNRVVTVIGPCSPIVLAIYDYAKSNQVPVISHWSGTTELNEMGGDYQFRTCPSDFFEGYVSAKFVNEKGYQRIGLIVLNDEDLMSIGDGFSMQYKKLSGNDIVAKVVVNPDQTTYRSELREIYRKNPDLLFVALDFDTAVVVLKERYAAGYPGDVLLASNPVSVELIDLAREAVGGVYGEVPAAPKGTEAYSIFEMKYRSFTKGKEPDIFTWNAYDAVNLFALAIEAAGEASGVAVSKNIHKVANPPGVVVHTFAQGAAHLRMGHDINYEGAAGPVDLDEFGNTGGSSAIQQVQNGKWIEIARVSVEVG